MCGRVDDANLPMGREGRGGGESASPPPPIPPHHLIPPRPTIPTRPSPAQPSPPHLTPPHLLLSLPPSLSLVRARARSREGRSAPEAEPGGGALPVYRSNILVKHTRALALARLRPSRPAVPWTSLTVAATTSVGGAGSPSSACTTSRIAAGGRQRRQGQIFCAYLCTNIYIYIYIYI